MDDLVLYVLGFIAVIILIIWILSKITVPLLKAGVSLILIILLSGVIVIIAASFWLMGMQAFLFMGLLLVLLVLKLLSF